MKYYYVYILLHKEQLHIHASQWIFLSPLDIHIIRSGRFYQNISFT